MTSTRTIRISSLAVIAPEHLPFAKTPKQITATKLQASFKYVLLYGGSRSGKTFITMRNIIIRACKVKSRHIVLRLHFNACKTAVIFDTLPKVWEECFPHLPPLSICLNKSDWFVQLPNGSQIWFGGLDDKERTEKILGTEFSTLYFNESSQFAWQSITMALTRMAENSGLNLRAYFDCNPPTSKHWSYLLFIKGLIPEEGLPVEDFATDYACLSMNPIDNMANLPADYLKTLRGLPKRQRDRFLHGMFLTDVEGALWDQEMITDSHMLDLNGKDMITAVSVDPAVSNQENSDLWGIIVGKHFKNGKSCIEVDNSLVTTTQKAAMAVINTYDEWDADYIVVETNQGGDLVENVLRLNGFKGRVRKVHASKGKYARAEPVSALYEQGLIQHKDGLEELETELMEYVPLTSKKSPDRLDALVWLLTNFHRIGMGRKAGVF